MIDLNDVRIAVTLLSFVLFIWLVAYTWSRRRGADHEAAALLPFADTPPEGAASEPQIPKATRSAS